MDPKALQSPCSPQTYNYVKTLTDQRERQGEPNNRQGAVYKIKCSDCQAS